MALRDYGLAELAVALHGLAMRGGRVHAGIHQARKAIRRTRAMLTLGATTLGPGASLIDRRLRKVNRRLSPLRDAHALVEVLDRLGGKTRSVPALEVLLHARRIAMRRRADIAAFAETLHVERAMLKTLHAALVGLPWQALSTSSAMEAMDAAVEKADAARARAFAGGGDADWHRWRRSMRRVSQQHHAVVAAAVDVALPRFDKALTERLGAMQDLVLLLEHCGKKAPLHEDIHELRRFAEKALERQRKHVRASNADAPQ
jgi:CHAD domain-containing protein